MSLVLLRRVPLANVAPATGYTVFTDSYDTDARRPYRAAYQAAANTGANAPFELALGALVPGATFCVNSTQRQVKYAGDGKVSTHDEPNAPACASSLAGLTLLPTNTTTLYSNDGALIALWRGGAGPLTVRCTLLAPSIVGTPDYYAEYVVPAGTHGANFPQAQASAVVASGPRHDRLTTYPPAGLAPGRYRVEVLEETGGMLSAEITLLPTGTSGRVRLASGTISGVAWVSEVVIPAGQVLLELHIRTIDATTYALTRTFFNPATSQVVRTVGANESLPAGNLPAAQYFLPAGTPVSFDALGAPDVLSNGQGGISTAVELATSYPRLAVANLIYFHPGRPSDATGGVVVEIASPAGRTPGALAFDLLSKTGAVLASNATGRFGGLTAGSRTVRVRLGSSTLDVPVVLKNRYGLKWRLVFDDQRVNKLCRLELWARDYAGPVLDLVGQAEPVTLETEGFAGGNTQADLPAVIGSSATLRLRTAPGALADLLADDRAGRADVYYDDALQFTGYLQPDIYEEPMVGAMVEVELTATDGLAALRDVDFAGHVGQELRGRWPVLHTLLHALSRTDLALPLALFTNRRALEMSSEEEPETDLYTDRLAYLDGDKPLDLRAVVDALAQQQGGTLVQRGGRWELRAALEAAAPAAGRTYDAAGDHAGDETAPAPAGRLTPERVAKADIGEAYPLYWVGADQHRQRRAGWRYLTATGDATFAENAFRQGDYFAAPTAWDASGTALRPEAGWVAAEPKALAPGLFPLQLVEAGSGSDELATDWPLATGDADARFLESELAPVAAGSEGVALELTVRAKWVSGLTPGTDLFKEAHARLWVQLVALPAGGGLASTGTVAILPPAGFASEFTTVTVRLRLPLPAGASAPRLRIHPYTYFNPQRARDFTGDRDPRAGRLLLQAVGLKLLPQGATWKAADAYYASGAGGSVRPPGLEVFHVDAPARAGLFGGVAHAFRRSVTRTAADNPATSWARADDLQPAPLLAAAVLDTLALRAHPSQVLTGAVHHTRRPPEILDSIDPPYDASGKRFAVGARSWAMKSGTTDVSLVEIGEGEHLVLPTLPARVRLLHGLVGGRVRIRLRHPQGIRAIHS